MRPKRNGMTPQQEIVFGSVRVVSCEQGEDRVCGRGEIAGRSQEQIRRTSFLLPGDGARWVVPPRGCAVLSRAVVPWSGRNMDGIVCQ